MTVFSPMTVTERKCWHTAEIAGDLDARDCASRDLFDCIEDTIGRDRKATSIFSQVLRGLQKAVLGIVDTSQRAALFSKLIHQNKGKFVDGKTEIVLRTQ